MTIDGTRPAGEIAEEIWTSFDSVPEQDEAKRLLRAALGEGPAHAYLFHGPAGVGKRAAAFAFAAALLGDRGRGSSAARTRTSTCSSRSATRSGSTTIRELRRDLHMRPFEADRRVYLICRAHLLNEEAADALLKDLEEPPDYAVIVLVADELGPLPETIRSRCQLVPFTRLSERAVREASTARAPELAAERGDGGRAGRAAAGSTGRSGCSTRTRPSGAASCSQSRARSYREPAFEPAERRRALLDGVGERGGGGEGAGGGGLEWLDLTAREAEHRVKRAELGAQREELLASLEELAAWYRDLVCVAAGAENVVAHFDQLAELARGRVGRAARGAERAVESCARRGVVRGVQPPPGLALEALFLQLRRAFAGVLVVG